MKCVICKTAEANQRHHVCYKPELLINICKPCHQTIHATHGVGIGEGECETRIKESHPFYTYYVHKKGVKDSETDELLNQVACECSFNRFSMFFREDKTACYLRCNGCGRDWRITRVETKAVDTQQKKLLLEGDL